MGIKRLREFKRKLISLWGKLKFSEQLLTTKG